MTLDSIIFSKTNTAQYHACRLKIIFITFYRCQTFIIIIISVFLGCKYERHKNVETFITRHECRRRQSKICRMKVHGTLHLKVSFEQRKNSKVSLLLRTSSVLFKVWAHIWLLFAESRSKVGVSIFFQMVWKVTIIHRKYTHRCPVGGARSGIHPSLEF